MRVDLPTNLLRGFIAIVDSGSMVNASKQVFVTQSALSLQIKRLEELVQQPLFIREGRRLILTPAGEVMTDYARRMLRLNDEAVLAVSGGHFSGPARVGMVQDFADTMLTGLLARFAQLHPDAHIFARVAGTAELLALLEQQQVDIILGYAAENDPEALSIAQMHWYGDEDLVRREVLSLAVLETPCRFREAAIRRLEEAGRDYRIAVETPNLSTLRAAVRAGLGITCRTPLFLEDTQPLQHAALPALPKVACIVRTADGLDDATRRLADLTRAMLIGS